MPLAPAAPSPLTSTDVTVAATTEIRLPEADAKNMTDVPASSAADDAKVHAVDTFSRGALRWGYFLLLNAIAGSIAIAFFVAVFYADGLDPYLMGTYEWLLAHPGVTSVLAFSPLACSLLVGYGYASRARKRKKLAAERAAARAGSTAVEDGGEALLAS